MRVALAASAGSPKAKVLPLSAKLGRLTSARAAAKNRCFMGDSGSFWENEAILEKAGWQLADGKITTLSAWAGRRIVTYHFVTMIAPFKVMIIGA
ncbi:hypothetical protein PRtIB026_A23110 [Pseudomonas sp. RtIB026]|nr:hypothetical protein PRtIB026_A23110 [Pseudomonas sp. RtIB026]